VIQAGHRTIRSDIRKLTNSIWNKEELPQELKELITVPIYEKADKTDCSNYRGLSLLSTTYKILSSNLLSMLTPMLRKLLGIISMDFDAPGQLLVIYSEFNQHLRKNAEKQCISYLLISRKLMIQLGGRFCIIFLLSLVYP